MLHSQTALPQKNRNYIYNSKFSSSSHFKILSYQHMYAHVKILFYRVTNFCLLKNNQLFRTSMKLFFILKLYYLVCTVRAHLGVTTFQELTSCTWLCYHTESAAVNHTQNVQHTTRPLSSHFNLLYFLYM